MSFLPPRRKKVGGTVPRNRCIDDLQQERSRLGAVYTGELLATWAAHLLTSLMASKRGKVLDPACGDGALLAAVRAHGVRHVVGVDCDAHAVRQARQRFPSDRIENTDGLAYLASPSHRAAFDGVIANPPWGATVALDRSRLSSLGYRAAVGQNDSWDLFVEGILRVAKPNAPVVVILPDALFLPEHRTIREILIRSTQINLVARLGEGFFSDVYRGTVVLAFRNREPRARTMVSCVRLSPEVRRDVLAGRVRLSKAAKQLAHKVAQARFISDPDCRFDIDARYEDQGRLERLETTAFPWNQWLEIGRGVELSKSGRIARCPRCRTARPFPRSSRVTCATCDCTWDPNDTPGESIVRANDGVAHREWYPLVVGEDVDRHCCTASRLIRFGVAGIRYKSLEVFAQPKLLVRKTGVGIKAVVDKTGAATNQVVFHFTKRPSAPSVILDYLEGVLCSRVMLAWHLKRHGEIEWRSHPYITPSVIRRFPVPLPETEAQWAQARAIADAVNARREVTGHDSNEDLLVERLVAGMYGLEDDDMKWVLGVLESVEQLEPIRTLRLPSASMIAPLRVARGAAA